MKYYRWGIIAAWVAIIALCIFFWRPIFVVFSLLFFLAVVWIKGVPPHLGGPIPN
jgi:hypothetical protein